MALIGAHVALAAVMFLLVNWIGAHSAHFGYQHLSPFTDADESPLFNAVYRVLAPNVCLVLGAALLYGVGADRFVNNIYLATIYYFVLRWTFLVVLGRRLLSRWGRQLVVAGLASGFSWFLYTEFLQFRATLLPSTRDLSNELWLLILLFAYKTLNQVAWPSIGGSDVARVRYLEAQFARFRLQYGAIIVQHARHRVVEALAYCVMIYESYNRPTLYQWVERYLLFPLGRARSLGPMQVIVTQRTSDEESIEVGVERLRRAFESTILGIAEKNGASLETIGSAAAEGDRMFARLSCYTQWELVNAVAATYNVRSDYASQIRAIFELVQPAHYPELAPQPMTADD